MSFKRERSSQPVPSEGLGSLRGCLVDGDGEQRRRERSLRRRSLAISVLLQSAVFAVLLLASLFGKPQTIALANITPMVPFGHRASHAAATGKAQTGSSDRAPYPVFSNSKPTVRHGESTGIDGPPSIDSGTGQVTDGPACSWCVDIGEKNKGPRPPEPEIDAKPRIVRMTTLDPAMLIHRVEPGYPVLAKQTHREGRVELRAIIGTDGTIQSLQVVSGDQLFLRSAQDAVQQWRYKPTILNGQAVEIDTYITVVYTMQR